MSRKLILFGCVLLLLTPAAFNQTKVRESWICRAGWYGPHFRDRKTASGERYDPAALTVADPTLPMGTIIRLTDVKNNKHVIARVNDRGPYVRGRCLDVSYAVAERLGFVNTGVADLFVEVLNGKP